MQVSEVEKEMASLCMHYLIFECFGHDLSSEELGEYLLDGSFAFQEYAALHWVDHLESVSSNDLLSLEDLAFMIDDYTTKYGEYDRDQEVLLQPSMLDPASSSSSSLQETTRALVNQTRTTRINDEGLSALGTLGGFMCNVRAAMEQLAGTLTSADVAKEMETYYGPNWFKCPKHPCFYFHEGFPSAKLRDRHLERHERPFCCTETGCSRVRIGFSSEKELKKHTSMTHPDPGALSWKFYKVKEPRPRQSFRCTLCFKEFTRSTSLRQHQRSHTNERPFSCSVCEKAFARSTDCKRHEKTHSGEKKFSCYGGLSQGWSFGCGTKFTRADALFTHLKTEAGRYCLHRLVYEEFLWSEPFRKELHENRRMYEEQMQSGKFPEVILQRYPVLRCLDVTDPLYERLIATSSQPSNGPGTAQAADDVSMD